MQLQPREGGDMGILSLLTSRFITEASRGTVQEREQLRLEREEARRAAMAAQSKALDALAQSFLDDIQRRPNRG